MKRAVVIKKELIAEEEARLLKLVHANPGLSRREIAKLMRLSTAATGYYVDRLLRDRFLLTGESIKQGRGRPKAPLYMNEHIGCFLGLDISGTYIRASCLDFGSNLLFENRTPIPDATPNAAVCDMLAGLIKELKRKTVPPFLGIGLSVPDTHQSVPEFVPLKLHDIGLLPIGEIAQKLSEQFKVPVTYETSINALGYGEIHYGSALRHRSCLSILARTDVSACMITEGSLLGRQVGHDAGGMIGQWMCPRYLFPEKTGVHIVSGEGQFEIPLEQVASTWGLAWQIRNAVPITPSPSTRGKKPEPLKMQEIREAYEEGDELVCRHVQAAAVALGWAIGQLVHLFNPEHVALAGPITGFGQPFLEDVQKTVADRLKILNWNPAQLAFTDLGEYAVAIGAAASSLDKWHPSR